MKSRKHIAVAALTSLAAAVLLPSLPATAQEFLELPDFTEEQVSASGETGSPEAYYLLATLLLRGKRPAADAIRGAELLTRAAEQGLAIAQLHLGDIYFNGEKLPQNDVAAFRWYQVAALQGLAAAQYGLARAYAEGRGTSKNLAEAVRWHEQAARQGLSPAQNQLGALYAAGSGTAKNLQAAFKWYSLSAAQGDRMAVTARDKLRPSMTAAEISAAQQEASRFSPVPHYNTAEITRQNNGILELVRTITAKK